jgi:hypothetical protein
LRFLDFALPLFFAALAAVCAWFARWVVVQDPLWWAELKMSVHLAWWGIAAGGLSTDTSLLLCGLAATASLVPILVVLLVRPSLVSASRVRP